MKSKEEFIESVHDFSEAHDLIDKSHTIILAVSGGVDSMVLWDVVHQLGLKYRVAHCNFQLRGKESEEDELFILEKAKGYNVPVFSKKFKTLQYSEDNNVSIQVAARELRYKWFYELLEMHQASSIATAHHLNDSIETFFLNLLRGTGLQGLTGIPVKNDKIIRPLLFADRKSIVQYALSQNLEWREDSSNEKDYYQRNYIRHHIVPKFIELNPSFEKTMEVNISRLRESNKMYKQAVQRMKTEMLHYDEHSGCFRISMLELAGRQLSPELFFEIIKEFDFNITQAENMLNACFSEPGKFFYSESHQALIDRLDILIKPLSKSTEATILINKEDIENNAIQGLNFTLTLNKELSEELDPSLAYLDFDKLKYPITFRPWKNGDKFQPLGMKGKKKLSDFLTDLKLSRIEKEAVMVLESQGEIIWVAGYRIGNPFKISETTKNVLIVKYG